MDRNMRPVGHAWVKEETALPGRRPADLYPTPISTVEMVLDVLREQVFPEEFEERFREESFSVLDPGCGDGVWLRELWRRYPGTMRGFGIEIRTKEACRPFPNTMDVVAEHSTDFCVWSNAILETRSANRSFELILGNPPYSLADRFVKHSLELLAPGGICALLLPSTFLFGQRRRNGLYWAPGKAPHTCLVHSQRISWQEDGKTPPRDSVTMVWKRGWYGDTRVLWLPNHS